MKNYSEKQLEGFVIIFGSVLPFVGFLLSYLLR